MAHGSGLTYPLIADAHSVRLCKPAACKNNSTNAGRPGIIARSCLWRNCEHVDLDAAHQLLRHAAQEQAHDPREPARADHQKIGLCLFHKTGDGIGTDALDDAGIVVQLTKVEALNELAKLATRGLELALGFLMNPLGRDAGMRHHLPRDRRITMHERDIGILQQPKRLRLAGRMA